MIVETSGRFISSTQPVCVRARAFLSRRLHCAVDRDGHIEEDRGSAGLGNASKYDQFSGSTRVVRLIQAISLPSTVSLSPSASGCISSAYSSLPCSLSPNARLFMLVSVDGWSSPSAVSFSRSASRRISSACWRWFHWSG